ncbi:MAG: serine/threonine protein kinase [Waddliaceae bacterium]|nr:serine/threonine protein kinase [Waddliaceae bacterium]
MVDTIGPYQIETMLGKGGMSNLYLGTLPNKQDVVIIKVLQDKYIDKPAAIKAFQREATILSLAQHPHIVNFYEEGNWEGKPYIVLEYIEGISLREFLMQDSLDLRRALELVLQIAYAICHLHSQGVIHRDLKPENILLDDNGQAKVIDFGVADFLDSIKGQSDPSTPRLVGTPIYMSPEQREHPEQVAFASDLYSLAIIAYELVVGRPSQGKIQLSILPKGLQTILTKALQSEVKHRYPDLTGFIADLTTYIKSPSIQKERSGVDLALARSTILDGTQEILSPSRLPSWTKTRIAIGQYHPRHLSGIYLDLLPTPNGSYLLVLAKPCRPGREYLTYSCVFRGILRTLTESLNEPTEIAQHLNQLLIKDKSKQYYSATFVSMNPVDSEIKVVNCQSAPLWCFSSSSRAPKELGGNNPLLGSALDTQYQATSQWWNVGDSFILHSARTITSPNARVLRSNMEDIIGNYVHSSPTKQVNALVRKWKTLDKKKLRGKSFACLSVNRVE